MHPTYVLLRLRDGAAPESELRALARDHPAARRATHQSRSYRSPLALLAWHAAPVGADIERIAPLERDFAESICSPAELTLFSGRLGDEAFVTSLWASKEALAKALGDAVAHDPRRLESPLCWSEDVTGRWRASGRWRACEFVPAPEHLAWIVWTEEASRGPVAGGEPAVADIQNSCASAASAASTRLRAGRR